MFRLYHQQSFRIFLYTIGVFEPWIHEYFTGAWIQKVDVSDSEDKWLIHVSVQTRIPSEIIKTVQNLTNKHFQPGCPVSIHVHCDQVATEMAREKVWYWIRKQIQNQVSYSSACWLAQAKWNLVGQSLQIILPNPVVLEMAKKKRLEPIIEDLFHRRTGQEVTVVLLAENREEGEIRKNCKSERKGSRR